MTAFETIIQIIKIVAMTLIGFWAMIKVNEVIYLLKLLISELN